MVFSADQDLSLLGPPSPLRIQMHHMINKTVWPGLENTNLSTRTPHILQRHYKHYCGK